MPQRRLVGLVIDRPVQPYSDPQTEHRPASVLRGEPAVDGLAANEWAVSASLTGDGPAQQRRELPGAHERCQRREV